MQPPQDPTNQSAQSWPQSSYQQPDQTMPPQSLPVNTYVQNHGQGGHPGEEMSYGLVPQSLPGNHPARYYPNSNDPPRPPKRRKAMSIIVLVLLVLVIILGATTVLALRRTPTQAVVGPNAATAQATSVPTATSAPVPTATSVPVATITPSSGATAQPAATVATGTITENLLLTCGTNCNDPIRMTITTVQVDDADGRMLWNISLKNVTGSSMGYGIDTFELLASGTQNQLPATFSQSSGTLPNDDPSIIQGTFAFVPVENTTYTLTVVIEENPFMGPQITFDPVQITNL